MIIIVCEIEYIIYIYANSLCMCVCVCVVFVIIIFILNSPHHIIYKSKLKNLHRCELIITNNNNNNNKYYIHVYILFFYKIFSLFLSQHTYTFFFILIYNTFYTFSRTITIKELFGFLFYFANKYNVRV